MDDRPRCSPPTPANGAGGGGVDESANNDIDDSKNANMSIMTLAERVTRCAACLRRNNGWSERGSRHNTFLRELIAPSWQRR